MDTYKIIVVDDMRIPLASDTDEINVVLYKKPLAALDALQVIHKEGGSIQELWLDHDMGWDDEGQDVTIKPVWEWLEEQGHIGFPFRVGWIFVHTSNVYKGDEMIKSLSRYYPNVVRAELPTARRRQ